MVQRIVVLLLFVCFLAPAPAFGEDATATLQKSLDQIIVILKDPAYTGGKNLEEQKTKIKKVVYGVFDFKELSKMCVGRQWSSFTPQQKEATTEAFSHLLESTYSGKITKYDNQTYVITESVQDKKGRVEVRTMIHSGDKEIPIYYRMKQNPDWKVYDVIVEGVSLLKNYRTQFQEIMVNGTPDDLIASLREKASKIKTAAPGKDNS